MVRTLYRKTVLNKPIEEVFNFFKTAQNLNLITPPDLNFTILTPTPFEIQEETIIDYSLKIHGWTIKWQTKITRFDPPYFFVDDQVKGPYKKWTHHHYFSRITNSVTEMEDKVLFKVPGGPFEFLVYYLFVKKKLAKIFGYRQQVCEDIFNR